MADRDSHGTGDRDSHGTGDHGETGARRGDSARRGAAGVPVEATTGHQSPSESAEVESTAADPPTVVALAGRAGVALAVGSLGLAVLGVAGFAVGLQPYGAVATVLALAGVTVAMVLGMAYQAYAGDWIGE